MYFITIKQLANAVNNLERIPVESLLIKPEESNVYGIPQQSKQEKQQKRLFQEQTEETEE